MVLESVAQVLTGLVLECFVCLFQKSATENRGDDSLASDKPERPHRVSSDAVIFIVAVAVVVMLLMDVSAFVFGFYEFVAVALMVVVLLQFVVIGRVGRKRIAAGSLWKGFAARGVRALVLICVTAYTITRAIKARSGGVLTQLFGGSGNRAHGAGMAGGIGSRVSQIGMGGLFEVVQLMLAMILCLTFLVFAICDSVGMYAACCASGVRQKGRISRMLAHLAQNFRTMNIAGFLLRTVIVSLLILFLASNCLARWGL
ncbi:hypothetical protein OZX62_00055 [Bifidobacterium sp. ESL0690]|uniref:hypothetical protein n=1 Tax=Bifidobacterium sp. ESL0690 TaxID=2983214 RepID=UPI0023F80E88|nr:hypothetical protein [Bifidobacterium sp. ESL0690]WEV46744.1 hypothetical protein OZX62_00055 [Bifidobacterium sp. ESL0690]